MPKDSSGFVLNMLKRRVRNATQKQYHLAKANEDQRAGTDHQLMGDAFYAVLQALDGNHFLLEYHGGTDA
jgi:hypothetical protein